jgi:hypothetical protein
VECEAIRTYIFAGVGVKIACLRSASSSLALIGLENRLEQPPYEANGDY